LRAGYLPYFRDAVFIKSIQKTSFGRYKAILLCSSLACGLGLGLYEVGFQILALKLSPVFWAFQLFFLLVAGSQRMTVFLSDKRIPRIQRVVIAQFPIAVLGLASVLGILTLSLSQALWLILFGVFSALLASRRLRADGNY
jgi:hypothetical protein